MDEHRIVSLIPSATEIVCALGFGPQLVGRSHECDFPSDVRRLPVCTAPKFEPDGTSYAIDQRVKAILQDALSVYRVNADTLERLQPTVIVTQEQCEVCAVNVRDVEQAVSSWLGSQPVIVSLAPNALDDVLADITRVATALGVPDRGETLVRDMRAGMAAVQRACADAPNQPRVACIEWLEPLMAAGNWMTELVSMVGGINLFGEAGHHSPWLTWDDLRAADPDLLVIMPCGFDIERTQREMPLLTQHPFWRGLRAVRETRVVLVDGNQYFNRPGPRLVDSVEILAEIIHPDQIPARHLGTGWVVAERAAGAHR